MLIMGSTSVSGNVAKCAPLNGRTGMLHTSRRLRVSDPVKVDPSLWRVVAC